MSNRFFSWFKTRNGRGFVRSIMVSAGSIYAACTFLPHTILIDKYVDIYYLYKSGLKANLPQDMQSLFEKSKDLLNIHPFYKKNIRCFPVFGFDLFHAGAFDSKFGVEIGIPKTFNYSSHEDIDRDIIRLNLEEIDWTSTYGEMLAESLVLTESEKLFGICREILMADNKQVYLNTVVPTLLICATYAFNTTANHKLDLFQRPLYVRAVLYTLSLLLAMGFYFLIKDQTQVAYEKAVDKQLCQVNPDFIHTGVTFYDKLLKRNMALRNLLGEQGKAVYTSQGNHHSLVRYKHLPLTHRKEFFEKRLQEANRQQQLTQDGEPEMAEAQPQ